MNFILPALICILALATGAHAQEETPSPVEARIVAALAHDRRPEADRLRDKNRKPLATLQFFRLQDDMTVLELLPGGGWYTRILGPTLAERGKLYLAIGTGGVTSLLEEDAAGFASTEIIPLDVPITREKDGRRFDLPSFRFGVRKVDMVLTFRNLHNFTDAGRANLNAASFRALKKGGYYGVVDHTRRHMAPDTDESWRRMDPVQMIREIEAAGFQFLDYNDLHYRPDDELRYEVGRKTITGNTDRFTLLFVKP